MSTTPREFWFAESDEYAVDEPDKCGLKAFVEKSVLDIERKRAEKLVEALEMAKARLEFISSKSNADHQMAGGRLVGKRSVDKCCE